MWIRAAISYLTNKTTVNVEEQGLVKKKKSDLFTGLCGGGHVFTVGFLKLFQWKQCPIVATKDWLEQSHWAKQWSCGILNQNNEL